MHQCISKPTERHNVCANGEDSGHHMHQPSPTKVFVMHIMVVSKFPWFDILPAIVLIRLCWSDIPLGTSFIVLLCHVMASLWMCMWHSSPYVNENRSYISYTICCPPVRGDNPHALASGLSYVQVDKRGITILYQLHQCRTCTSRVFVQSWFSIFWKKCRTTGNEWRAGIAARKWIRTPNMLSPGTSCFQISVDADSV